MREFCPFSRLPLELRKRVWELAMEPREVAVGLNLARRPRTAPPSILHASSEARTHLQGFYDVCFGGRTPEKYSLVNFNLDTVYCSMVELVRCDRELPRIRRLIVECVDAELFFYKYGRPLYQAAALDTVTILHYGHDAVYDTWWREWDGIMQEWYYRDDPVTFTAKIISPDDPNSIEISPDNYLKIERDWRRKNGPTPEEDPDYQVSDSDDDVDAPWRFRQGYRHVEACDCPSKRAA
ncbi:hypothetical protein SVAN01_07907 [Stagonosporopsis vannaccii]|nr:hypothetical protein SVAN01_07907 [Stagonosporopsis vannaccii]